jgi:signal transduction histidine kinase
VSNAVKYTERQGKIVIVTDLLSTELYNSARKILKVQIIDSGEGVSEVMA